MTVLSWGEWRPDVSGVNSPYVSDVQNVFFIEGGVIPAPELETLTDALPAAPTGGIAVRDSSGGVHIFAGTAEKLYKLDNTDLSWDDVSKAATTYASTTSERWRFRAVGNFVVAVNINTAPQVYQVGVSSAFADLGGSPPNARYIAVWENVLALFDNDTAYWSDIDDITNWSTGNSGEQPFVDGGVIMGATDATNPIIFQKEAIRLGTFIPGSAQMFAFQKIHDKRGAASPYSICTRGEFTFFADNGGFYQISPIGQITPIGFSKVDRTIFNQISGSSLFSIYGEIDPFHPRVYFAVSVDSDSATSFDRLLVYDWNLGKWTQIETEMDILFPLAAGTIGFTLESLSALYPDLETVPYSLDSKAWQGGAPLMAAFATDLAMGYFQGENAEAVIATQEIGEVNGGVTFVDGVTPQVDTNEALITVGTRNLRGDTVLWGNETPINEYTGIVDVTVEARYQTYRMRIPAGTTWSFAQGVDVNGRRVAFR